MNTVYGEEKEPQSMLKVSRNLVPKIHAPELYREHITTR